MKSGVGGADYSPLRTVEDIFESDGEDGDIDSDESTEIFSINHVHVTGRDVNPDVTKLQRSLGLLAGVSYILGNVVGSGIFISPTGVLKHAGSVGLSLIIWVLCGFITFLGALSYLELGASYPTSGGGYSYINETIGELPAFLLLWISVLARVGTNCVILSMTFANYLLYGVFGCVPPPSSAVRLISFLLITVLTAVNMYSVRVSSHIQSFTVFGKLFALLVIISTGLIRLLLGHTDNIKPDIIMNNTVQQPDQIALAIYVGLFAYSGWDALNFIIEELKDPFRLLPRAIYISLPLISLIYLLTNVSYFSVLTKDEVLHSHAVAVSFSDSVLGPASFLMPLFVACSTFGSVNSMIMPSSRLTFVGARNGHLPQWLSMLHTKFLTPVPSLLLMAVLSLIMLLGHDVYKLIIYVGYLDALSLVTPIIGMLVQRYRNPGLKRPFRVWTVIPVMYVIIYAVLLVLPWFSSPVETCVGLALCLSGLPVYYLLAKRERRPVWLKTASWRVCRFIQILTMSVTED